MLISILLVDMFLIYSFLQAVGCRFFYGRQIYHRVLSVSRSYFTEDIFHLPFDAYREKWIQGSSGLTKSKR